MADRYDPTSVAKIDKYDDVGGASADTWAALVTHITGYPVPDRSTVFDTLRSAHGGKLFRMDIKERSLSMLVKDSGFLTNKGEDYDIWFFDSGKKRSIMQARIVFEGRVKVGDEVIFAGTDSNDVENVEVREGNEFTDYHKDKFSTVPLAQYMNGPRAALLALLKGGTENARFSNLGVAEESVVDLASFTTTGESFDYAAKFFKDHAPLLKDWEDRFGRDDASWKGEAAEVFRGLLKKVRENYDSYVETFNSSVGTGDATGTGNTVYSRALSLGRSYLVDAASTLLNAWLEWAKSPYYDPHRVLRYVLDDLAQWVDTNNVAKTDIKSHTTRYITTVSHSPQGGFSQVHPDYGDLADIANWAKVGDKAVEIWNKGVDDHLVTPARGVQSKLNNQFLDLGKDFAESVPKPKSTSTASEEYEKRKLEEEKKEIKKENEENKQYQEELRKEQERQRDEDKQYQDELREEQERQRDEDKKYQDGLREEQNRQRDEDKQYQDELREEQRREQEEAKNLQEELRNEQNQQRDEDKQYAGELREEQRREQEEAQREAEEQQKVMEESLGGINDPNAVGEQNLGNLDDLLNQKIPVTESVGDLGGDQSSTVVPPSVSQNLGSLGNLNNAGGSKSATDAANDAISQNLGNLGDLNGGSGGSLETPTGGSTDLSDGKLTTEFPDGSSSTFDPDSGLVTTTHPDGSVTTQDLGDGIKVTNPDGSVTSLGDDGKLTTTFPDGSTQTVDPSTGQAVTTDPDGNTTTQNLGSLGNLNGSNGLGDLGDINADLPTESTGNLGDLNGGSGGSLETPTGGSTDLGDGKLTTEFPDGSSSTFDPDSGLVTTTHPDGSVTTQDLGDGIKVTNPDGSVTSLGDDGKLTTTFPDGSTQTVDPSTGQAVTTDPDGNTTTQNLGSLGNLNGSNGLGDLGSINGLETPTGGHTAFVNDDFATTFADGSKAVFDPDSGTFTSTGPDGSTVDTDLTHGAKVTNPDGSTTFLDDGKLTTTFPDGSKQVIDPETGITTVTDPQGKTETIDLKGLNTSVGTGGSGGLGDLGSLDGLNGIGGGNGIGGDGTTSRDVPFSELGVGGGQVGAGASGGGLSGAGSVSLDGLGASGVAPLSDSATAGAGTPLAAATGGTPGAPGTPGSPGMPMGGGMGGTGAGGEKGNGERVRAVLVDAAEESERRNRRRRSPWNRQEDSDTFLAPASRVTTTGSGGGSQEGEEEPGRRPTTSADYLEEDADVWGTEEGGTPAVIGR
ncbi:AAWKG family protein [Streptomyces sp. NBC_01102]|uniref:AAWKG family protein n=1 Tax=unclassified Streptomyces TaxID=2593676 RepID=UPI00386F2C9C|nr:AAWKG family protein [Streptomyces sp. NBC_01102]